MSKIYFASDFHLGVPAAVSSADRERLIVRWLESVRGDAEAIYLVGDLFDFWFEYGSVVPKGFTRLLGTLASISDQGVPMHFFTGNHDMWIFRYFEEELGIPTHRRPVVHELQGKTCMIGHGDGLGPGDRGYKMLKKIFASRICQRLFALVHPDIGTGIANYWSAKSRYAQVGQDRFMGEEGEWLLQYAQAELERTEADYFIFGHRHLPVNYLLKNGRSRYVNLGDWLYHQSYGVMENGDLQVDFFENPAGRVVTGP